MVKTKIKEKKERLLSYLKQKFQEGKIFILFGFKGVQAPVFQVLRKEIKKAGGEIKVVKKTLLQKVLKEKKLEFDLGKIKEEVALVIGKEDPVSLTKSFFDFSKKEEKIKIFGGIFNNEIISEAQLKSISELPSREILLSQFLFSLIAPLQKLLGVLQAPMRDFVYLLNQIQSKVRKEGS